MFSNHLAASYATAKLMSQQHKEAKKLVTKSLAKLESRSSTASLVGTTLVFSRNGFDLYVPPVEVPNNTFGVLLNVDGAQTRHLLALLREGENIEELTAFVSILFGAKDMPGLLKAYGAELSLGLAGIFVGLARHVETLAA